jgi:AraC-like DNA-binding protein
MSTLSADIYGKLVASKLFIDEHFDEAIDLETIASHAFMSPFHFHRLFTKVYRITPHQYITKKRLEKAKELLKTGQVSISGSAPALVLRVMDHLVCCLKNTMAWLPNHTKQKQCSCSKKHRNNRDM